MSTFGNLTISGKVTQTQPASQPTDLVRLGEVQAMLVANMTGYWQQGFNYVLGQQANYNNALYLCTAPNTGMEPDTSGNYWMFLLSGGAAGVSSYVYVAYASDANGDGFSLTPGAGLGYVAFLTSGSPIAMLAAVNFAGLWLNIAGANGAPGTSAFVYTAYASDASGTNFSLTPTAGLGYLGVFISATAVSPLTAANFTGLWLNVMGSSSYAYIAYASDNMGTNFSLSPSAGLGYVGFLVSTSPLSPPVAANFAGLWMNFQGAIGLPGQSSYVYIAYASDTNGTNFSTTPSPSLNFIALITSATQITSLTATSFAGYWKQYAPPITGVSSPLQIFNGVLSLNANANNIFSALVQRDSNGNFAATNITMASAIIGAATLSVSGNALQSSLPIAVSGLTVGTGSGVVKATNGALTPTASTTDLPEGTNQYHTNPRVLATPLAGYTPAAGQVTATDSVLTALQKLAGNIAAVTPTTLVPAAYVQPPSLTGNYTTDMPLIMAWMNAITSVLMKQGVMSPAFQ
jgi:hypothetical protein